MSPLYLRRIEISNFRAYGEQFSIALPGPGVTILTGPEGLGKSAFFESIEWALTGRVRRLEALTREGLEPGKTYGLLARREGNAPVAHYRVALEFVDEQAERRRIERRVVRETEGRERFAEVSAPAPQQVTDLLGAAPASPSRSLRAIVDAVAQRRAAESRRGTLLQLKAVREKVAQGVKEKTSLVNQNDRHTHELWMVQSYVRDAAKSIKRINEMDNRIHSLLQKQQEIERCQQAHEEWGKAGEDPARKEALQSSPLLTGIAWEQVPAHLAELRRTTQQELEEAQSTREAQPDLENLKEHQAQTQGRVAELSSIIKENHKVVSQIEQDLVPDQAFLQQHPELLAALGKLPEDEAKALEESTRAVEQLLEQERQLTRSGLELGSPGASDSSSWSRWQALLLDESLLQQDPVSPEAFLEVLLQLVQEQRYQVILSTRDEQLAEDMHHKLVSAGIECVTCRYQGLGPAGVLYSTVP